LFVPSNFGHSSRGGWKPISLTSVFFIWTSIYKVPSGMKNGCPYIHTVREVGFLSPISEC
jgi:hypothetical protein